MDLNAGADDDLEEDDGASDESGDSGYNSDDDNEGEDAEVVKAGEGKTLSPAHANAAISKSLEISKSAYNRPGGDSSYSSPFRRMLSPPLPLFSAYKKGELRPAKTMEGMRFLQHGPTHINWHPPELEPLMVLTPNESLYLTEQYRRDSYRSGELNAGIHSVVILSLRKESRRPPTIQLAPRTPAAPFIPPNPEILPS